MSKPILLVIFNQNGEVVNVKGAEYKSQGNIVTAIYALSKSHPEYLVGWCREDCVNNSTWENWASLWNHDLEFFFFNPKGSTQELQDLGYVDFSSPFFKYAELNRRYPTWLVTPVMGFVSAKLVRQFNLKRGNNFSLWLLKFAFFGNKSGVLTYHEPQLAKKDFHYPVHFNYSTKLNFVRAIRKRYWLLHYAFSKKQFDGKFLWHRVFSYFFLRKMNLQFEPNNLFPGNISTRKRNETVDVIIPTLSRKTYLADVLSDLSKQKHLPENVFIIEQNPIQNKTELGELLQEKWPFKVVHHFTQKMGACNARNVGLEQAKSAYILFLDDDVRFDADLIQHALQTLSVLKCDALNLGVYMEGDPPLVKGRKSIWSVFGTCAALVKKKENIFFDSAFELGYGEDKDFGIEYRKTGTHIYYDTTHPVLHLKAGEGGFRFPVTFPWSSSSVQPKPTPHIMKLYMKHATQEQLKGYKLHYFLKGYLEGKKPTDLRAGWKESIKWANQIS